MKLKLILATIILAATFFAGYKLAPTSTVQENSNQTSEVEKTETVTTVVETPTSKTTTTKETTTKKKRENSKVKEVVKIPSKYRVGVFASSTFLPAPTYGVSASYRVTGPFWVDASYVPTNQEVRLGVSIEF